MQAHETFVLDFIPADAAAQDGAAWLQEQRPLLDVDTPGLLAPRAFGALDEFLYIATPFVDGATLERLARREHIAAPQAVAACIEVARLAVALERAVGGSHGWLAPANVVVTTRGAISIGPLVSWERYMLTLPTAKRRASTYTSYAPEVIHGKPANACADVFALGVLLFRLLGGAPHEDCDGPIDILQRNLAGFRDQLEASEIHPRLTEVLASALEVDPHSRTTDLRQLADQLAAVAHELSFERTTAPLGKLVDAAT